MPIISLIMSAILIITVSGCSSTNSSSNVKSDWKNISDWQWFSLKSRTGFKEHILRDDGSVALTTYDTSLEQRIDSDYSIHLYSSLPFPCSPELTGASKTTKLTTANGMAEWGRVNIFDSGGMDFPPDFKDLCRPPVNGSAYVLCSEKEEKTVVICISQMKDDPVLAKQIFETFEWTK